MKSFSNLTTLGRSLDLSQFSNRYAIILALITFFFYFGFVLIFITQDLMVLRTYTLPIETAIFSLLTWAIGREFHPDDPLTAMAGQLLSSILLIFLFPEFLPSILALIFLLVCARCLLRTSGRELKLADHLILIGLTFYLGLSTGNWIYPMIATVTYAVNAYIDSDRTNFGGTALMSVLTLFLWNRHGSTMYIHDLPLLLKLLALSVLVVSIIALFIPKQKILSTDDQGSKVLRYERVLATQGMLLLAIFLLSNFASDAGLHTSVALWPIAGVYPFVRWFNR